MRTVILLICLFTAGTCFAEDPLESLNTIEDTLSTMEQALNAQAVEQGGRKIVRSMVGAGATREEISFEEQLYFVSDEPLGALDWIKVRPCNAEGTPFEAEVQSECCVASGDDTGYRGTYVWKGRAASLDDLRPGEMVIARAQDKEGEWFLARIIDVSNLGSGDLAVSAPFRAQLKGLKVVDE